MSGVISWGIGSPAGITEFVLLGLEVAPAEEGDPVYTAGTIIGPGPEGAYVSALASAIEGATRPGQQITWTSPDGTAFNLTGATITGLIRNRRTQATRAIAGTLTVTTAASGIFTWAYHADDVATAGAFDVQFIATYASPPTPAKTFVATWHVRSALAAD